MFDFNHLHPPLKIETLGQRHQRTTTAAVSRRCKLALPSPFSLFFFPDSNHLRSKVINLRFLASLLLLSHSSLTYLPECMLPAVLLQLTVKHSDNEDYVKMVNTRAKIKKTKNTLKNCFPQASITDSDHQSTSSAILIASNDDLLTEILLRLPVTSILLFKSVSKHWWWLLSNRPFTLLYDKPSIAPGLFVRYKYIPFDVEHPSTPPIRNLGFNRDLSGIRIVQFCNGLLLYCSNRGNTRSRKFYVFNPTTKKFAIIPPVPGVDDVRKTICFVSLAFHQTSCPHYKLVCIRSSGSEGLFVTQIYSSNTGEWKTLNNQFENYVTSFETGVYWNGAIHWAPSCLNPLYFDLNVEQLQKLPLPLPVAEKVASLVGNGRIYAPVYFVESRGHLHMVDVAFHEPCVHLNLYKMSADHSRWFVKYKVDLDHDFPGFHEIQFFQHPYGYVFEVIDVVRGEEEDTLMVLKSLFCLKGVGCVVYLQISPQSTKIGYKFLNEYVIGFVLHHSLNV